MTLVARTTVPPPSMVDSFLAALRAVDPALALYDVRTMESVMREAVANERFATGMLGVFAALALSLAVVGNLWRHQPERQRAGP